MNLAAYKTRLRDLPCVVGYALGLGCVCHELHHAGPATDRDDWNLIPLCKDHHQGPQGIHPSRRAFESRTKLTEMSAYRAIFPKEPK